MAPRSVLLERSFLVSLNKMRDWIHRQWPDHRGQWNYDHDLYGNHCPSSNFPILPLVSTWNQLEKAKYTYSLSQSHQLPRPNYFLSKNTGVSRFHYDVLPHPSLLLSLCQTQVKAADALTIVNSEYIVSSVSFHLGCLPLFPGKRNQTKTDMTFIPMHNERWQSAITAFYFLKYRISYLIGKGWYLGNLLDFHSFPWVIMGFKSK